MQQIQSEDQLQAKCFQWFHNTYPAHRGKLFHVNQKARNAIEGNKFKAMGVVPGVSDFILIRKLEFGPAFIELKFNNGKQSDAQLLFSVAVTNLGYQYFVCRSFEEFKDLMNASIWKM